MAVIAVYARLYEIKAYNYSKLIVGELHVEFSQVLVTMSLVNCCVVDKTTNRTIFPWSILSTGESEVTVWQLFEDKIVTRLPVTNKFEF